MREKWLGGRRRRGKWEAMSERVSASTALTGARRKGKREEGKAQIGIRCHLRSWS